MERRIHMLTHASLHHYILTYILDKGHAPDLEKLKAHFSVGTKEMTAALEALQEYHGVVLHPDQAKIWVIHPISLAPTPFLVSSKRGSWWGNCAWCSLGLAALLNEDVSIQSRSGAEGEQIELHIVDGELQEKDYWVHFPIPMRNAWDNVIYTCTTMLLFKDKEEIPFWSEKHDIPLGDIQPVDKIWRFARKWYGNHLNPNWVKWTAEEAKEIFAAFDLTHSVWQLDGGKERF